MLAAIGPVFVFVAAKTNGAWASNWLSVPGASLSTVRLSVGTTMGTAEEIAAFLAPFPPFAELGRDDFLRAAAAGDGT